MSTILIDARKEQDYDERDSEKSMTENDSDKQETTKEYIIDNSSFLRHNILLKSYYLSFKRYQREIPLEECELFSEFPPPRIYADMLIKPLNADCDSELSNMLQEERPGLLDISWVSQVRATHKESRGPMTVTYISFFMQFSVNH